MRAALFAALFLAACAQPTGGTQVPPPADLPQHVREDLAQRDAALREPGVVAVGLNEAANLGGGLVVTPREVLEDSRCPQNARCIWAGRLRVRVDVQGAGSREVTLGEEPVATPNGAFALVAVSPGRWTDWPREGEPAPAYRFGFSRA